jgi:hypothetical protein
MSFLLKAGLSQTLLDALAKGLNALPQALSVPLDDEIIPIWWQTARLL